MLARPGDQIYFQHRDGPACGMVLGAGKHGAIVEYDGQRHKMRWDRYLGHRERMEPEVKIVSRGADGALVEDRNGRRQFVRGEVPGAEGYGDKLAHVRSPEDGELRSRSIERVMHGSGPYHVLDTELLPGNVSVGSDASHAPRLLRQLERAGHAFPYEVAGRSVIEGERERHGYWLGFQVPEEGREGFVNAVAHVQRRGLTGWDEIIVRGSGKVHGMRPVTLATRQIGDRTVLAFGKRDGFNHEDAWVSPELVSMHKGLLTSDEQILFLKAHVKQHPRRLKSGKVVIVRAHETKAPSAKGKSKSTAATRAPDKVGEPPTGWEAEVARERAEVEDQNAALLAAHDRGGKPLPAPNGKPSQLNGDQWIAVRTRAFKRWFGDWEALARRNALQTMVPIQVVPNAISESKTGREARKIAREEYRGLQRESAQRPIETQDGRKVRFGGAGFRETALHSADHRVLSIIPVLPKLLAQGIPLWSEAANKVGDNNIVAYHHYGTKARFPGGEAYVRMVVREEKSGNFYYDNDATSIEDIEKASVPAPLPRSQSGSDTPEPKPKNRLLQWWQSVNPAMVSKVVDENGEPLMVYHVTDEDFEIFRPAEGGSLGPGMYFTSHPEYRPREGRGTVMMPVFLDAKAPMVENVRGEAIGNPHTHRQEGFDSVKKELPDGTEHWLVTEKSQIKSAIGNRGTYDPKESNIVKSLGNHSARILFFKSEQLGLFDTTVPVKGYTRGAGVYVKPYTARHKRARGAGASKVRKAILLFFPSVTHWISKAIGISAGDPDNSTKGAMVALMLSPEAATQLTVPDGIPAAEMHITLVYLGKNVSLAQIQAANGAVQRTIAQWSVFGGNPLEGQIGGLGIFPPGPDGAPCFVPADIPGLERFREMLVEALRDSGVSFAKDHGFTPHVTRCYLSAGNMEHPPLPVPPMHVEFSAVTVKHGEERHDIPFDSGRLDAELVRPILFLRRSQ